MSATRKGERVRVKMAMLVRLEKGIGIAEVMTTMMAIDCPGATVHLRTAEVIQNFVCGARGLWHPEQGTAGFAGGTKGRNFPHRNLRITPHLRARQRMAARRRVGRVGVGEQSAGPRCAEIVERWWRITRASVNSVERALTRMRAIKGCSQ